MMSWKNST